MKADCDQLKNMVLDKTNKEIILKIEHTKNDIEEMKQALKTLKIYHEEEQANNAKSKYVVNNRMISFNVR